MEERVPRHSATLEDKEQDREAVVSEYQLQQEAFKYLIKSWVNHWLEAA